MLIDEVIEASRPYKGRKYDNMTVLQRLRCDLSAEAADYDHTMMHARSPYQQRQATRAIGDELVEIAQNYAWRYAKHKQLELIEELLGHRSINNLVAITLNIKKAEIESDLKEYQQQFRNMQLM